MFLNLPIFFCLPRYEVRAEEREIPMTASAKGFTTCLAISQDDVQAAQRLRYAVFIEELGGRRPFG